MDLRTYANSKFIGGGCKCGNAPNCGHFADLQGFAMRSAVAKTNPSKKSKKERGKKTAQAQTAGSGPKQRRGR